MADIKLKLEILNGVHTLYGIKASDPSWKLVFETTDMMEMAAFSAVYIRAFGKQVTINDGKTAETINL